MALIFAAQEGEQNPGRNAGIFFACYPLLQNSIYLKESLKDEQITRYKFWNV